MILSEFFQVSFGFLIGFRKKPERNLKEIYRKPEMNMGSKMVKMCRDLVK